jgi:RNA polymerase sigma factor (sigma-70 family)
MGLQATQSPNVSIFPVASGWQVLINENGRETVVYFMLAKQAHAFAESQQGRLGLSTSVSVPHAANTNAMVVDLIPALRAFARTFCRNANDADDLVQETLTRALRNLHQFTPGTRLKSWLFTIMRNTFFTKVKLYNRERPGDEDCVSLQRTCAPTQEWSLALHEVENAIARLPHDQREALVLVTVLGTAYQEAATICDCEVGTIKSRLNRARANLLRSLGHGTVADLLPSACG